MKDKKILVRFRNVLLFLWAITLLLSTMYRIDAGVDKSNEIKRIERAISYDNYEERENNKHFNIVSQTDSCVLPITSHVRLKLEECTNLTSDDFGEIDRMPKVRLQSARSKIPDIRTNV